MPPAERGYTTLHWPQATELMRDNVLQSTSRHGNTMTVMLAANVLLGACAALGLAWFMSTLISGTEMSLDTSQRNQMLDFVRVKRSESVARKDRKPERPPINDAPDIPDTPQSNDAEIGDALAVSMPDVSGDGLLPGRNSIGIGAGEGDYLPIVKVAPIYPHRALARGIEGSCTVRYDVTALGTTRNIEVVEGQCVDAVFYKPSVEAAKRFKYKPRVIDGVAVEVLGVYNVFHFIKERTQ